ncbi:hypothetical protein [Nonomuraea polychroma]|nr:hypothetical protein [Nonomuraea polychroma]
MDKVLPATLQPALKDLYANCAVRPTVRLADVRSWEEPFVWLHAPDGSGQGVQIRRGGDTPHQVADLADQVQEWAVEALWLEGLPAVWPECPAHPDTHPLSATVTGGVAVWACPQTKTVIAAIGGLPERNG